MKKRYRVMLTEHERLDLQKLVSTGKAAAKKLVRARIVLLADQEAGGPGLSDPEIVEALGCGRGTVERVRQQFVEDGLEAALQPPPRQRVDERRLDGKAAAQLVALACGSPPEGRARWTLRLLAERMVAWEYVEELSDEPVRRTLQKTHSSRG